MVRRTIIELTQATGTTDPDQFLLRQNGEDKRITTDLLRRDLLSGVATSSTTTAGLIETATTQETVQGVATNLAATPAGVNAAINGSDEKIQDTVGAMVSGNTEQNILVTYQDLDGTLDFHVPDATSTQRGVAEFATPTEASAGTSSSLAVTPAGVRAAIAALSPSGLTNEQVEDIVGGMVSGNTESNITVTYQDSDGTLDFSVPNATTGTRGAVQLSTSITSTSTTTAATSSAVRAASMSTLGFPTALNAVRSYAMVRPAVTGVTRALDAGSTVAGSTLRFASATGLTSTTVPSGTWRIMGYTEVIRGGGSTGPSDSFATVAVRIS